MILKKQKKGNLELKTDLVESITMIVIDLRQPATDVEIQRLFSMLG